MRRADHACIYGLIAGTYTPLAMLALPPAMGRPLLLAVWGGAVLGALKSLFWVRAPKWLSTLIYLGLGWAILPVARPVAEAVGPVGSWLIALGGIAYTLGAVAYVVKRPNPWAGVFGYHELFHAMTLVATGFHFTAVARVVVAAAR
jgi:hemolysin III